MLPSSNYGLCGVLSKSLLLVTPSFLRAVAVVCRVVLLKTLQTDARSRHSENVMAVRRDTFDMSIYSTFQFHFRLAKKRLAETLRNVRKRFEK